MTKKILPHLVLSLILACVPPVYGAQDPKVNIMENWQNHLVEAIRQFKAFFISDNEKRTSVAGQQARQALADRTKDVKAKLRDNRLKAQDLQMTVRDKIQTLRDSAKDNRRNQNDKLFDLKNKQRDLVEEARAHR